MVNTSCISCTVLKKREISSFFFVFMIILKIKQDSFLFMYIHNRKRLSFGLSSCEISSMLKDKSYRESK